MRRQGLLNPELAYAISRLGHTDTFAVADCGLPIPAHVKVIDLALIFGIPRFADVVSAVLNEVVVEGATVASETPDQVRATIAQAADRASGDAGATSAARDATSTAHDSTADPAPGDAGAQLPLEEVSHEELKKQIADCSFVIRTGETTPYANVIFRSGVAF